MIIYSFPFSTAFGGYEERKPNKERKKNN